LVSLLQVRSLLSYEHFFVIYCRFYELDQRREFRISKADIMRNDSFGYSKRAIDRVFSLLGGDPDYMCYEDFVWFLLSEEDKTTDQSLEYFFNVLDLDGDGRLTPYELSYFYADHIPRLQASNQEMVLFEDLLCQFCDMIRPQVRLKLYLYFY
jgi:serine/threonine-protein phosphatase 2A regulatory subunit B''